MRFVVVSVDGVLIGLQLRAILNTITDRSSAVLVWEAVLVGLTVIVVRIALIALIVCLCLVAFGVRAQFVHFAVR